METHIRLLVVSGLTICAALWAMPGTAHAQIFVANFNSGGSTIGEYNFDGTTINASLVSGLNDPDGLAVYGSDLFVPSGSTGTIGEYTTTGGTVNASLVSGLNDPLGIAVSGVHLFVANYNYSTYGAGSIGDYTTSGATVNASLVSGLYGPESIALLSGGDIFVGNGGSGTIGEYTVGGTVNASLVSGLSGPNGVAVVVPEPTTLALAGFGGLSLLWLPRWRKQAVCFPWPRSG